MREIGGYIELDTYNLPMLHEDAVALNCGRNCLAYLFRSRNISRIKIPYLICDSIIKVCEREGIDKSFYHIGLDFKPMSSFRLDDDEWLYLINYYGQLKKEDIIEYVQLYKRVIVDQANDYYAEPISGVDTIYTCRKWFGVSDGAFLYTDSILSEELCVDESYDRMRFLLGRYEKNASDFYNEYCANNQFFDAQPIKKMSKLTNNLLHGIDYQSVYKRRIGNFVCLHNALNDINRLELRPASFMYPFMVDNGALLRKRLQSVGVYIPTLWPIVLNITSPDSLEYKMAENILPLPIDQRYSIDDMEYVVDRINQSGG